nr:Protein of uncharacterised function (DUF554) [Klebsiella pneumoniae]
MAIIVLFCASGTGVFGAMREGMTGDASILIAKAFLDFSPPPSSPAPRALPSPPSAYRCCLSS